MLRDAMVYLRQLLRDYGFTISAARQAAKLIVRATSPVKLGVLVPGIRRWPPYDFSMRIPFGFIDKKRPPPKFRIASVCHMFYPELSGEFREVFTRVPGRLDLVLSTDTEAKGNEISTAFAGWDKGDVDVRIVPNRGRDIAPKLTAYADVYDRYDVVLYVHSKRTVRENDDGSIFDLGDEWRRHLLHNLAGSAEIVGSILEAFRRDPRLGMVMPQHWERVRGHIDWREVFFVARDLAHRMGIRLSPAHVIDFPSGSMFWARPGALKPALNLGLRVDDFPVESGQHEDTLAHTIERLFLFSCEAAGYRWAKVCDVAKTAYPQTAILIETPEALDAYHRRHGFRLTALGAP